MEDAMKSLGLYRQMEDLYRLRALLDGINRESLIAESRKWRERAELEIEFIFRRAMEFLIRPCIRSVMIPEQRCAFRQVKLTAVLR
jgi:hypothetical protein